MHQRFIEYDPEIINIAKCRNSNRSQQIFFLLKIKILVHFVVYGL